MIQTGFIRLKHTIRLNIPSHMDLRGLPRGGNLLLKAPAAIGAAGAPPFCTGINLVYAACDSRQSATFSVVGNPQRISRYVSGYLLPAALHLTNSPTPRKPSTKIALCVKLRISLCGVL
jgi:hypothetical protein